MPRDLTSKKTRYEFLEYFVSTTLREIETELDLADVPCNENYEPYVSGQRRSLVEQHYLGLDFSNWDDGRKILIVYGNVLAGLEQAAQSGSGYDNGKWAESKFNSLRKWIERDGFAYKESTLIPKGHNFQLPEVQAAAAELGAPELHCQIDRMRSAVDDHPALAIGTAKELIETTCTTILCKRNIAVDANWDPPRLVKETRKALKLLPEDIPDSAKGAEAIRRLLSSLGTIAQGLGEFRNLYGTGHGRDGSARGVSARHTRLAVGASSTLATSSSKLMKNAPIDILPSDLGTGSGRKAT